MTQNKQNGQSSKQFKEEELLTALRHVEDLLDGVLTPFMLLGETAYQAVTERPIAGSRVVVGVKRKQVTPEVISTIKTLMPDITVAENGFTYKVGEVPVTVKFIRANYQFFEHPDSKHFMWDVYKVPNPFEDYWAARSFIR